MSRAFLLLHCFTLMSCAEETHQVRPLASYRDQVLGLEVVKGELLLRPGQPWPQLVPAPGEKGIDHVFLVPPPEATLTRFNRQNALVMQRLELESNDLRNNWSDLRDALAVYGKVHGGMGPTRLDEPDWLAALGWTADRKGVRKEGRALRKKIQTQTLQEALEAYILVPRVPLDLEAEGTPRPLLLEKAPLANDGRHWVLDNQFRQPSRLPVDKDLLSRLGAELDFSRVTSVPDLPDPSKPLPFTVLALRRPGSATVRLEMLPGEGKSRLLEWNLDGGSAGKREILETWAKARSLAWDQGAGEPSPLWFWFRDIQERHFPKQLSGSKWQHMFEEMRDKEGRPSILSLFGGRDAVKETLQMESILQSGSAAYDGSKVRLADIRGIEVASHPWETMLPSTPATVPALTRCVPQERALLFLPEPRAALQDLAGGGAAFLARVNAFAHQGTLDLDIVSRAMEDLGLGSGLGQRLLETDAIREMVVFLPDLNFLAGIHITVVADLAPDPKPWVVQLAGEEPRSVKTPIGEAWWARRGKRFFLSTSRQELDLALALHHSGGQGSVGNSAEFQVMLGKLPTTASTRAYAYLSDPFIRRLEGPAQRILQMRQALARRAMEAASAGVELRRLEAPGSPLDRAALHELGYLPDFLDSTDISIGAEGHVTSRAWGSLAHMHPVPLTPPKEVEAWEESAYAQFLADYIHYWRRYFDPIAMRLETRNGSDYALETFILPLLDQSAYRELKAFLKPGPLPNAATAPQWSRLPVATLSLPVDWSALEASYPLPATTKGMVLPIPMELLEALGKEVHVAFLDGAPVIQIGGGSPSGLFDAPSEGRGLLFFAPLLLGPITRPVVAAVPIQNKAAALTAMQRLALEPWPALPEFSLFKPSWRIHRETDQRLVVSGSMLGIVTIRASIEVQGDWLVLCNDTTQPSPLVTGTVSRPPVHAALTLRPASLKLGLQAAWQGAVEAQAERAWAAQRWLAPWLSAGLGVEAAVHRGRQLLGRAPNRKDLDLGPGPSPVHGRFGTPSRPRFPPLETGEDFGLFEGIREVQVGLTFEDDGLRSRVEWIPAE